MLTVAGASVEARATSAWKDRARRPVLSEEVGNGARVPSRQSKVTVEAEVVMGSVVGVVRCCRRA